MVDGRWSMVDGRWSMVDGRWSMTRSDLTAVAGSLGDDYMVTLPKPRAR
jgi:hypothetical protein